MISKVLFCNLYMEFLDTLVLRVKVRSPARCRVSFFILCRSFHSLNSGSLYGENVNAIYTQVWCTLIAQLLLTVIQKQAQTKKAFSVVASLIRIHLISLLDVYLLLKSTNRSYNKEAFGLSKYEKQLQLDFL